MSGRRLLVGAAYATAGVFGVTVAVATAGCGGGGSGALSTAITSSLPGLTGTRTTVSLGTTTEAPGIPAATMTETFPAATETLPARTVTVMQTETLPVSTETLPAAT